MEILKNLNDKQKEAVVLTEGPVLIIAGPGSGKTKVLTHRIAYLIEKKVASPANILAVTFTNKAAREMKERITALMGKLDREYLKSFGHDFGGGYFPSYYGLDRPLLPTVGTFHNICARILRQEGEVLGYKRNFIIYDDDDQSSLIKEIMEEAGINVNQFNPAAVKYHISSAKSELITPEKYSDAAEDYFQENVSKIYSGYQKRLKKNNSLDFDDLIMQTVALFLEKPEILAKYQEKFRYIMVDEYQDTNHAQYKLVDLLGKSHRNICVVGDDWQSIYKWRGADIRNILEFEKNYPEAKVILLEQNYRSTQNIINGAYHIISKNANRKEKKLWTKNPFGNPIVIYEAADEKGEAEFIISEIARLTDSRNTRPIKLKDIAILYRINAQSRSIEETFLKYGLAYKIVGGIKFYARKEIKDIIAYLRFLKNPEDLASLERIINIPTRGIGKKTLEKIIMESKKTKNGALEAISDCLSGKITKDKVDKLKIFSDLTKDLREKILELKTREFLEFLIKRIDYQNYIKNNSEESERKWENVRELFSAIERYSQLPAREGIDLFLEEVSLAADLDYKDEKEDLVTLMTLHAAKGLEFDAVFIIGAEEGLLPHSKSVINPSEMEEERRLCYVGITRAKTSIYLVFARIRKIFGSTQSNMPSRFLSDIPENIVEYRNQGYNYLKSDDSEDVIELD